MLFKNIDNVHLESDVILKVEHLSKKFSRNLRKSMYYGAIDSLRSMIGISAKTEMLRKSEFWALDDISFELKKGETLGLVGENGCGKTTLLRLINGIFPPDVGRIAIKGQVGALIAVGAGFHPHMTGRENIYLNGIILGMTRKEVDEKMELIIEFADIGDFLEAPVSTYSSGMRVRLGFAIAIHTQPDILLIDEILAVGDVVFRGKCLNKIRHLQDIGVATIIVSHNTQTILDRCTRAVLLEKGKMIFEGTPSDVISKYEDVLTLKQIVKDEQKQQIDYNEKNPLQLDISILDENGRLTDSIVEGAPFYVNNEIYSEYELENVFITIYIKTMDGVMPFHVRNDYYGIPFIKLKKGRNSIKVLIDNFSIMPGGYSLSVVVINRSNAQPFMNTKVMPVNFEGEIKSAGVIKVDAKWIFCS